MAHERTGMCSCNRSRGFDELKARNEELEQVAWEMFQLLEMSYLDRKVSPDAYAEYRDRLEACGVETYGFCTDEEKKMQDAVEEDERHAYLLLEVFHWYGEWTERPIAVFTTEQEAERHMSELGYRHKETYLPYAERVFETDDIDPYDDEWMELHKLPLLG